MRKGIVCQLPRPLVAMRTNGTKRALSLAGDGYTGCTPESPLAKEPVPEPAALFQVASGLVSLVGFRRELRIRTGVTS
jgi:hypothetical protein